MLTFLFYNIIGFIISLNIFTILEYTSDPDNFAENMYNYTVSVGFWTFDKVVSLKMLYDNFRKSSFITTLKQLYYNLKPHKQENNDNDKPNIELIYNELGDIIELNKNMCGECVNLTVFRKVAVNNSVYYVENGIENVIIPKDTPIFSIILTHNNISYDIYDKLRKYFVFDNVLTHPFFVAFMLKYYNVDIRKNKRHEDEGYKEDEYDGGNPNMTFKNKYYEVKYLDNSFNDTSLNKYDKVIISDKFTPGYYFHNE